ncbi:uncharacterized protein [Henckelia pumila]|uniref:uncharacterized protein n=1 Tax=Henckelia pumila TaxID=405737 RepID=UPI003C6E848A
MHDFSEFIVEAGLIDAGYVGSKFTWTNKRVWKRLDRVLMPVSWSGVFNDFKVEHLHRGSSDHCPLQISSSFLPNPVSSFRFQNIGGIKILGNVLDKVRVLDNLVAEAEELFDKAPSDINRASLSLAQANLSLCLSMEEAFWKQKAACKWAAEGERNTKLLHNMVNRRRLGNNIFRIWENGAALDSPVDIQASGVFFFEKLLTGDPKVLNLADLQHIPALVTEEDKNFLLREINEKEILDCIQSLNADSEAGPDSYSAGFFKHCWTIIKSDLLAAVREFMMGASLPRSISTTTIILIPKVPNAQA